MSRFPCPYLNAEVELTEERERHVAERHPDVLPEHRGQMAETLADPDQVRSSRRYGNAKLFSRWYTDEQRGKHLVVVVVSEPDEKAGRRSSRMAANLRFKYDREADILHIDKCPPYAEQESEELPDEIVARLNPDTGEVENLEVLFFTTRLLRADLFELPVTADLRLVSTSR